MASFLPYVWILSHSTLRKKWEKKKKACCFHLECKLIVLKQIITKGGEIAANTVA